MEILLESHRMLKIGIITLSDSASKGERESISNKVIAEMVKEIGVVEWDIIIPDELELIRETIKKFTDDLYLDLILTTGGTGLSPRDVTPEATLSVIEREIRGIAEIMRMETYKVAPRAVLSRAVAGVRKDSLIVNLPGSPKAVKECLAVVLPILIHAVDVVQGQGYRCGG